MHTLRYVSTNICGCMRNSAITLVYADMLEIGFKYVKALSHYDVWHQRMSTYEKFSKYVGVH